MGIVTPIIPLYSLAAVRYPCYIIPKVYGRRVYTAHHGKRVVLYTDDGELLTGSDCDPRFAECINKLVVGIDGFVSGGVFYIYDYFAPHTRDMWYSNRFFACMDALSEAGFDWKLNSDCVSIPVGVTAKGAADAVMYESPLYVRTEGPYDIPCLNRRLPPTWFEWDTSRIRRGVFVDAVNQRGEARVIVRTEQGDAIVEPGREHPPDLLFARKESLIGSECAYYEGESGGRNVLLSLEDGFVVEKSNL